MTQIIKKKIMQIELKKGNYYSSLYIKGEATRIKDVVLKFSNEKYDMFKYNKYGSFSTLQILAENNITLTPIINFLNS